MHLVQILTQRWRALAHKVTTLGHIGVGSVTRLLPQRLQAISHELAKFGTIGVINLLVNFAVFNLLWLTFLRDGEVKAKAVATIIATTCAYFMNRHWTYRDRPKSTLHREYSLFFFFNLVGAALEVAVVAVAKYGFGQTHIVVLNLCGALGIVLGTIFRFWAYRTHVFKLEPAAVDAGSAGVGSAGVGASPNGASLNGAGPPEAGVNGASPNEATLNGATLNGASPNGVTLNGATLNGGGPWAVDPNSVDLTSVDLTTVDLAAVDLTAVDPVEPITVSGVDDDADAEVTLHDELAQIELDTIVAREQARDRASRSPR